LNPLLKSKRKFYSIQKKVLKLFNFCHIPKFKILRCDTTSRAEYYDWEDAMEDFLRDRGLESRMKIFFGKQTFSKQVLKWWINLQQQHIARGEDPYWTWKGMKVMLQCRFDPPLKAKKIAVVDGTIFLYTKQTVCSSWSDSIIGHECLEATSQQFVTIKYSNKKKVVDGADQNKKSMNAAKSSSSKQCEKNSSAIASTKIFSPCKNDRNNYSTTGTKVSKNVTQHAENSCTHVEQLVQSSCDASTEHHVDPIDDASNGLSILAQGVQSDGTVVQVKGQCSNIFQSQYKIQDKVCKIIVDGSSFTNAISSDLVATLSLSTWRLPTPCYMQWMNQSGMLKITHKVRVNNFPLTTTNRHCGNEP
jgi:hypothetical protein